MDVFSENWKLSEKMIPEVLASLEQNKIQHKEWTVKVCRVSFKGEEQERSSSAQKVLFDKMHAESYGFVSENNDEIEKSPLKVVWLSSC